MRYQPFAFAILASQLGCIGSIRVSSAANLRETAAILVNSTVGDVCFDKSMTEGAARYLLPQLAKAVAIQILDIQPQLVHLYFSQIPR